MMSKSNVFMNWTGVTITPLSGTTINVTQVLDVQTATSEGLEPWQADGHLFPTLMIRATASRSLTIVGGDVAAFLSIPRGVPLTIVAVLNDAVNQAGGAASGSLTHTWTGAYIADVPASGPSNKFAGGTATFMCKSVDGTTDPLAIVQA
jgi:hypothetical protein